MRVLILADRSFAARERDLLTRVQVGLIDEGIRVVEALPAEVADPDANPLIPTIPYSDRVALLASRARTRRLIRSLQAIDPPLAPAATPFALVDVIHVFGETAWPLALAVAEITGAALAIECASGQALRSVGAFEKSCASLETPVVGAWFAANDPLARALESAHPRWPIAQAAWGTHERDRPFGARPPGTPLSISIIASGDDPASILGLLAALAGCAHLPADAMMFLDAIAFERHPNLWRKARDLNLLDRLSLIDCMEARRDLVLQTDVLAIPEASGQSRSIILDAMISRLAILARSDPLIEATAVPDVAILAPVGTVDAWSDALTRLLANPEYRITLGAAARTYVLTHRPVHKQVEAILRAYQAFDEPEPLKHPGAPKR